MTKHRPLGASSSDKQLVRPQERPQRLVASNRKARHEYFITESYEAGIELRGTEVKSLRAGKCNLQDSYALFEGRSKHDPHPELYVLGMHVSPYEQGNIFNHEPTRKRKLLLKRSQLTKLLHRTQEKGYTLVPLSVYFSGPYAKIELGVAKGKKQYDKRADMKERDAERSLRRYNKED
jgi:SsrA-binding protein